MSIETHHYRADIDGLRALAIIPVVLYHAGVPGFGGGFVGVDVFFVISGYLITSIIEREISEGRFSLARFYERRVRRILPALFTVMAVCAVVAPFLLYPEEYRRFARSLIYTSLFVSSVLFRRESGYFDTEAFSKPLLHTWSLSVEELFYVVYPLASLLLWRRARDRRVRVLAVVALLSFVATLIALYNDGHSKSAFYLAHFRAWELLVGALLALGAVRAPQRRIADALSVVGVLMIGAAVVGYSEATTFPGLAAVLPCLGAGLVLLSGQHHPSLAGRWLSHRPVVFTGLIAYSFYLWHWPMLVFAYQWMGRRPSVPEGLGLVAASFVLAALSWRYIERPFRGKSGLLSRRNLFAAAFVAGAVFVGIGAHGDATKGWPGRYPAAYRVVLAAEQDRDPRLEGCISTAPDAGACIYGKQGATPKVALWGDSHAAVYAVMLGRLAEERDASLVGFTMAACPPADGWQIAAQGWRRACDRFQGLALKKILETESIRTVVLAANFVDYLTVAKSQPGFREAFHAVVDQLLAAGKRVIVVYPLPLQSREILKALPRAAADGKDLNALGRTRESYLDDSREAFALLDGLGDRPGLVRVYPHAALCAGVRCSVFSDGRVLYFDQSHLSLSGAEFVSSLFERALEP